MTQIMNIDILRSPDSAAAEVAACGCKPVLAAEAGPDYDLRTSDVDLRTTE